MYRLHYYDLVLIGVIVPVLFAAVVGYLTAIPIGIAVVVAGLVSLAVIAHGLFVNGPVDSPRDLTEEAEDVSEAVDDLI